MVHNSNSSGMFAVVFVVPLLPILCAANGIYVFSLCICLCRHVCVHACVSPQVETFTDQLAVDF